MSKNVVIIIPFTDVNEYVLECIRGCLELNCADYTIVLLPDTNISLPDNVQSEKISIIPTGPKNIAQKRNIGISNAPNSQHFAFIDSDAFPHRDWLQNAVKSFSRSPDIWIVGGPDIEPPGEPLRQRVVTNANKTFIVSGLARFCKFASNSKYCKNLHTCNFIAKKSAMDLLNGFNEHLRIGEDHAMCNRVRRLGGQIYFDKDVIVYHHSRNAVTHYLMQKIVHGYCVFDMIRFESSRYSFIYFFPLMWLIFLSLGWLSFLISPLLLQFWCIVTVGFLLIVLIETFRYSRHFREVPLTCVSILVGNLAYGVGSALAALNIDLNLKHLYKNYELAPSH